MTIMLLPRPPLRGSPSCAVFPNPRPDKPLLEGFVAYFYPLSQEGKGIGHFNGRILINGLDDVEKEKQIDNRSAGWYID